MERLGAVLISFIFWLVFALLAYYGARLQWWSAIALATLFFMILLNTFYPPSRATNDGADYLLAVYMVAELIGIVVLLAYLLTAILSSVRQNS